jgi:type II secretory pathway predicted ATPase ExeA
MLTNHAMDSAAMFACLLAGQPTLRHRLKLGQLAALDQRIAVRYHMTGMTIAETTSYLKHHLALAGRSDTLFSDDAVRHEALSVPSGGERTPPPGCRGSRVKLRAA